MDIVRWKGLDALENDQFVGVLFVLHTQSQNQRLQKGSSDILIL